MANDHKQIEYFIATLATAYNCEIDWHVNKKGGMIVHPVHGKQKVKIDLLKLELGLQQIDKAAHIALIPLGMTPHWAAHVSVSMQGNKFFANLMLSPR